MRELLLIGILATGCAAEGAAVDLTWPDAGQLGHDAGSVDTARMVEADTTPSPDTAGPDAVPHKPDTAPAADVPPAPDAAPQLPPDCSDVCKALGWCTPAGQACTAAKDADCDAAWICQLEGACVAKGGKCAVGNDKGCHVLSACKAAGLCTWNAMKGKCVAAWDADCAESEVCKTAGKCKPVNGACCDVGPDGLCKP